MGLQILFTGELILSVFGCDAELTLILHNNSFPKFFSVRVLLAKLDVCIVGVMSQQVPFCVCVDWTCHQQSSCCWSGVQPHS